MPFRRRNAFTLLELCLAMAIGLLLMLLAVPSVRSLLAEQRLKEAFERFDRLVAQAKSRSVNEQQAWRIVWDRDEVTILPVTGRGSKEVAPSERLVRREGETFRLQRPAALRANPPAEWVFWPNGTCEPAVISFAGPSGKWEASYNALTGRGTFIRSEIQ